jgi:predicted GIY-YIG superfamily endonuclease
MYWVYVLELQGGRRYVGFSKDVGFRVQQHIEGRGARATQQAKVLDVHLVRKHKSLEAAMQGERDEFRTQVLLVGAARVSMGRQFDDLPLIPCTAARCKQAALRKVQWPLLVKK